MKQKKKFLALLILGLIIIANIVGTRVFAAHTQENIKVGFFLFPGYHIVDKNGRKSGYGYEYLQYLRQYTGWNYTYIGDDGSYLWALNLPSFL